MAALQTERLILRQWRDEDREPYAVMNADAEVRRFFAGTLSRTESDAQLDRFAAHIGQHGWGLWAVERREDGALLGFVGLNRPSSTFPFNNEIEIGWRLERDYWGRGYASEAASRALLFAFEDLKLPRVVAYVAVENLASIAVMRRIGMNHLPEHDFIATDLPPDHPFLQHRVYASESPAKSPTIREALIEGEQSGEAKPFDFDDFIRRKVAQHD